MPRLHQKRVPILLNRGRRINAPFRMDTRRHRLPRRLPLFFLQNHTMSNRGLVRPSSLKNRLTLRRVMRTILLPRNISLTLRLMILLFRVITLYRLHSIFLRTLRIFRRLNSIYLPRRVTTLRQYTTRRNILIRLRHTVRNNLRLPTIRRTTVLKTTVRITLPIRRLRHRENSTRRLLVTNIKLSRTTTRTPFRQDHHRRTIGSNRVPRGLPSRKRVRTMGRHMRPRRRRQGNERKRPPRSPKIPTLINSSPGNRRSTSRSPPRRRARGPTMLMIFIPKLLRPRRLLIRIINRRRLRRRHQKRPRRSNPNQRTMTLKSIRHRSRLGKGRQCPRRKNVMRMPRRPVRPQKDIRLRPRNTRGSPRRRRRVRIRRRPPRLQVRHTIMRKSPPPYRRTRVRRTPRSTTNFLRTKKRTLRQRRPTRPYRRRRNTRHATSLGLFSLPLPRRTDLLLLYHSPIIFLRCVASILWFTETREKVCRPTFFLKPKSRGQIISWTGSEPTPR